MQCVVRSRARTDGPEDTGSDTHPDRRGGTKYADTVSGGTRDRPQ